MAKNANNQNADALSHITLVKVDTSPQDILASQKKEDEKLRRL